MEKYIEEQELNEFIGFCKNLKKQKDYAEFKESDELWNEKRKKNFENGIISGLYLENNEWLLSLINKQCNHRELKRFLEKLIDENYNSDFSILARKYDNFPKEEVKEPLINFIAEYNYLLAFPICKTKAEIENYEFPERVFSYVYIILKYKFSEEKRYIGLEHEQPNIQKIYSKVFDKRSIFKSWGLIPIDETRGFYENDEPVRIYDKNINKTIFLDINRPLACVLKELCNKDQIMRIAFRGNDNFIYDGENHRSFLKEEMEKGLIFTWNIDKLPTISKLYDYKNYDDCLWIIKKDSDLTFEELCDDVYYNKESFITQVIHLQYKNNTIVHIDHEFIFYSPEQYEQRNQGQLVKGESEKRIKTIKIDNSKIPMNYPCTVYTDGKQKEVPFLFFFINCYFQHKDLLCEYFREVL